MILKEEETLCDFIRGCFKENNAENIGYNEGEAKTWVEIG